MVISSVHGELGGERKFEHLLVAPRVNEPHTRLLDVLRKGGVCDFFLFSFLLLLYIYIYIYIYFLIIYLFIYLFFII